MLRIIVYLSSTGHLSFLLDMTEKAHFLIDLFLCFRRILLVCVQKMSWKLNLINRQDIRTLRAFTDRISSRHIQKTHLSMTGHGVTTGHSERSPRCLQIWACAIPDLSQIYLGGRQRIIRWKAKVKGDFFQWRASSRHLLVLALHNDPSQRGIRGNCNCNVKKHRV